MATFSDSIDNPSPEFFVSMTLPNVVTADVLNLRQPVFPGGLKEADIERLNTQQAFIHFQAWITYRDIFDNERVTRLCLLWNISQSIYGDGSYYGTWVKCGPPEANRTT